MSTTGLPDADADADAAVPELVAAAVVGYGHGLQAEGTVIRGVVRAAATPPTRTTWRATTVPGHRARTAPGCCRTPAPSTTGSSHPVGWCSKRKRSRPPRARAGRRERRCRVGGRLGRGSRICREESSLSREVVAVFGAPVAIVVVLAVATAQFAHEHPWWKDVGLPPAGRRLSRYSGRYNNPSAMAPRDSAGRKLSNARMTAVAVARTTKLTPWARSVPTVTTPGCCLARRPARARTQAIGR